MAHLNIFRATLVLFGAAMLTTACTFQEDDFFSESASLRVTHTNDQLQDRLVSQSSAEKHGWVIQYFVAGTDDADYEGFNLFGRFYNDGKVTLAGNHRFLRNGNAGKYTEHTSFYEFLAEEGPVLSFNTWNDILTVFEDPVDPSTLAQNGEGMFGDHNLVLRSYNDNEIVFSGERHSAKVRFVPCDRSWTDYIAAVDKTKSDLTSNVLTSYYVTNSVDTMFISDLATGYFNYCDRIENPLNNKVLSCVFTPTGFRIENPDTIGGKGFQEFTVSSDSTCLVNEDGNVKVIACWDNYVIAGPSDWRLDPAKFTVEQTAIFQQIEAEVKKVNSSYVADSIMIGQVTETLSDNTKMTIPSLLVYVHGPAKMGRTSIYKPSIDMNIVKSAFGQVTISEAPSRVPASMEMFKNSDLQSLCEQFAKTLFATYTIKPNHFFHPTYAELTPANGGTQIGLRLKAIK